MIKDIDADPAYNAVAAPKKEDDASRLRNDYTVDMMLSVYKPVSSKETLL